MSAQFPTIVVIPEGYVVRISAQTASRDYDAVAVAGEYELEYTDVNYAPVPNASHQEPYFVLARIRVVSPERRQSSVEFGGVALASEVIPASVHDHVLCMYVYEVEGRSFVRGGLELLA